MPKLQRTTIKKKPGLRFEAVKIDPLFEVLDAVAWLDSPGTKEVAQYADIDHRTAGKILKNARLIGLVQSPDDSTYVLAQPYATSIRIYDRALSASHNDFGYLAGEWI